jgi:hypothetical protein
LIPSSKLLASKPRDCTLKREQNSCYEHDNGLKPANLYQGCVYAWNAHREGKAIQSIKHDPKKGLYDVHE